MLKNFCQVQASSLSAKTQVKMPASYIRAPGFQTKLLGYTLHKRAKPQAVTSVFKMLVCIPAAPVSIQPSTNVCGKEVEYLDEEHGSVLTIAAIWVVSELLAKVLVMTQAIEFFIPTRQS